VCVFVCVCVYARARVCVRASVRVARAFVCVICLCVWVCCVPFLFKVFSFHTSQNVIIAHTYVSYQHKHDSCARYTAKHWVSTTIVDLIFTQDVQDVKDRVTTIRRLLELLGLF